jgi:serralysin
MAPRFRFLPYLHEASDDSIFTVAGDVIHASFIPSAGNGGGMEISPTSLFSSTSTTTTASQSVSGSTVAVTSGGITINLLFDAAAMAAPASFRAGIQQAASILGAAIFDKITVNIQIDYSGTGGGAAAGPDNGLFESYSSIRADLINHATPGDTSFNALPSGSSIQGQSNVAVWNAQLKLWGLLGANDTTTDDGSATFATDINSNLLVGVALHELTHALGRIPYGSQPDIFDLFRFTSVGTRLFSGSATAPAAYFSVDGGHTKLADYGQTSDSSDFLNSGVQGPNDPFNEFYTSSTSQQLTAVDLKQMVALGFHMAPPLATTVIEAFGSTSLVEVGSNYFLNSTSGGTGPELKFGNGAPYAAGQAGTWSPIGAEQTSTGYEVAWKAAGADQYSAWSTDGNGTYISNIIGVVSGTSATLETLETSFHQDLNGDGTIGVPARTNPAGANLSSINPASSTQIPGGDGISALDLAHYLSGQASERWHFDFSSPSGSGGIPELEGSFPGIADNKLLTALMSHPQAGQPFQPADGGHEPPGYHDGMTVGNAALADLHTGYFIFS